MYEIRLIVNRGEGEEGEPVYRAEWTEPDGPRSEPFPLALPLGGEEAEELRWYLETYVQLPGPGDHVRARRIEGELRGWGRALFEAIFPKEAYDVYRNMLEAGEQMEITVDLTAVDGGSNQLGKDTEFTLELKPAEGGSLVVTRLTPHRIDVITDLH